MICCDYQKYDIVICNYALLLLGYYNYDIIIDVPSAVPSDNQTWQWKFTIYS